MRVRSRKIGAGCRRNSSGISGLARSSCSPFVTRIYGGRKCLFCAARTARHRRHKVAGAFDLSRRRHLGRSTRLAQSGVLMNARTKRCSKCGAAFACGAHASGCWCEQYPPLKPVDGQDCLCPGCLSAAAAQPASARSPLTEGEDYYLEGAAIVFTAAYHLRRGYCCRSGCRHCPYTDN